MSNFKKRIERAYIDTDNCKLIIPIDCEEKSSRHQYMAHHRKALTLIAVDANKKEIYIELNQMQVDDLINELRTMVTKMK